MTGESIPASMADVERRLARLRGELARGEVDQSPALEQATEDLRLSLDELHVALEELETTNEDLATSKVIAEEERHRYQELFRLIPAACLVTDTKGVIQEANEATESLLGRRASHLIGKPISAFIEPSDHSQFFQLLDSLAGRGEVPDDERELRVRAPNHRQFFAGVSAVPVLDAHGREVGARWLLRDLTRQLQKERDRREAGDREAYRYIAGGVIHHVNNILCSIRGNAEIIEASAEAGERCKRAARNIHAATDRGERLTSQLMAFSRVGRQKTQAQRVNVLVQEACEIARETLPEETTLSTDLAPDAGTVNCDAIGFYQATLNLIFNARDSLMSSGEIGVATRALDVDAKLAAKLDLRPGHYVAISVTDSGAGMDAETRARASEPFFSTKAIGSGFGLGLSTAEAIVRESQGALELRSDRGAGTTATFYLPRS